MQAPKKRSLFLETREDYKQILSDWIALFQKLLPSQTGKYIYILYKS